ncbi:GntR family transcriptional regulator [Aestuariispira insulae]|uniref:GntR family transcriptional regulator n=2 Tax=Aestuariispira insulae TaxID=1461337 RepID=A0A3D9H1M3_9PROT|nr:GntR family transcriptional regulator [Aestuariispira insulae]
MKSAIEDGRLPAGTKLPPHRDLAHDIGISVHTVSKAYEGLRRQGLVGSHVGRGTYVLDPGRPSQQPFLMDRDPNGIIDLSISRPVYDPYHAKVMDGTLRNLPEGLDHDTYLACRPNVGLKAHRESGVKWLRRCGLETKPENIIMTNGVCNGMTTALATIAHYGDTVVTEDIAHHLIISLCAYFGLKLKGLQTDQDGIVPEAFEKACKAQEVKVLFTVPTQANPTVTTVPDERRRKLAEIARHHDVTIIEDDVWGPLMTDRPVPISMLAPERSIYLTSFSKCTLSGLRAGYMVAPDQLIPALTGRMLVFNWMATPLVTEIASRWVEDGTAEELVAWQRRELALRHAVVAEEMAEFDWRGNPAALHFWLRLPETWTPEAFVEHAQALGVAVAPPRPFAAPECKTPHAVRVSLGGAHSASSFRRGLKLLSNLLKRRPDPIAQPF